MASITYKNPGEIFLETLAHGLPEPPRAEIAHLDAVSQYVLRLGTTVIQAERDTLVLDVQRGMAPHLHLDPPEQPEGPGYIRPRTIKVYPRPIAQYLSKYKESTIARVAAAHALAGVRADHAGALGRAMRFTNGDLYVLARVASKSTGRRLDSYSQLTSDLYSTAIGKLRGIDGYYEEAGAGELALGLMGAYQRNYRGNPDGDGTDRQVLAAIRQARGDSSVAVYNRLRRWPKSANTIGARQELVATYLGEALADNLGEILNPKYELPMVL